MCSFFLSREAVYVYFDCIFKIGSRVQDGLELADRGGGLELFISYFYIPRSVFIGVCHRVWLLELAF